MDMRFEEEMSGTYRGVADGYSGGEFRFGVAVDCTDIKDPKAVEGRITGKVFMEGVVDGAPLDGRIEISPLWKRTIAYEFTFPVEGKTHRFQGTKNVKFYRPVHSMTVLPGKVYDDKGNVVAEATVRFLLRDLFSFLGSYRFARTQKAPAVSR